MQILEFWSLDKHFPILIDDYIDAKTIGGGKYLTKIYTKTKLFDGMLANSDTMTLFSWCLKEEEFYQRQWCSE